MNNKYNLSFGNFIAHFIPGFLLLFTVINSKAITLEYLKTGDAFLDGVAFFVLSLTLGLCIDSIRYLAIKFLHFNKSFSNWCLFRTYPDNPDEIIIYNWIIDNYYRYHQFTGNLALSLLFGTFFIKGCGIRLLIILMALILSICSAFMFKTTIECYSKRFPNE